MASIDKTYTNSYKDYIDLVNWSIGKIYTCPNGTKIKMSEIPFPNLTEDMFGQHEIPVMNTSYTEDYFIIKHCPLKFVQDRMIAVYGQDYVNSILNGTSEYDRFNKDGLYGTKFKVIKKPSFYKKMNRALNKVYKGKIIYQKWWVDLTLPNNYNGYIFYDYEHDKWIWNDELGNWSTNCCTNIRTIKALKRKIRKWKLPKGTIVNANCRYTKLGWGFLVI